MPEVHHNVKGKVMKEMMGPTTITRNLINSRKANAATKT
jgi:hypothetical protein